MYHERLKILLRELGISQRQFALQIGIDAGYFSRILSGKAIPSSKILLLIESVFNVNKEWMENGSGEIFSSKRVPAVKKQILQTLDELSEEQLRAVLAFIKYLSDITDGSDLQ